MTYDEIYDTIEYWENEISEALDEYCDVENEEYLDTYYNDEVCDVVLKDDADAGYYYERFSEIHARIEFAEAEIAELMGMLE